MKRPTLATKGEAVASPTLCPLCLRPATDGPLCSACTDAARRRATRRVVLAIHQYRDGSIRCPDCHKAAHGEGAAWIYPTECYTEADGVECEDCGAYTVHEPRPLNRDNWHFIRTREVRIK